MSAKSSASKIKNLYKEQELLNNPIINHPMYKLDIHIKETYLLTLLILANLEDNICENQIKFIKRLINGSEEPFEINELLEKASSISESFPSELFENFKASNIKYNLVVDMMILLALDEIKSESQVELITETALILNITSRKAMICTKIARAIIEQDSRIILELSRDTDNSLENFICYIRDFHKGLVSHNKKLIYLYGDEIEKTPFHTLLNDRNNFSPKEELFKNSIHFTLEKGLTQNKNLSFSADVVIIENYILENEELELIIENCKTVKFINCSFLRAESTPLIIKRCREVHILDSEFRDISDSVISVSETGNFTLENSIISNSPHHRIINLKDIVNFTIIGNTFNKIHFRQLSEGLFTFDTLPLKTIIKNNYFFNCANQSGFGPLLLFSAEKLLDTNSLYIDDNSFEKCYGGAVVSVEGLEIFHYKNNLIDNSLKFSL